MDGSVIGAPPDQGLEQHLRRKRLQEPGGCIESPTALRSAEAGLIYLLVELARKACFFRRSLEILMNPRPATAAGLNRSGPPGRLAQLPNLFRRDSDIVQQMVIQ
jgi:hypothetical protein